MATNKELFNENMSSLVDVVNNKTGSVGNKTIDELITTANKLVKSEYHVLYVNHNGYLVNPYTYEVYIGDNGWTEEQKAAALEAICADYHLTINTYTFEGNEYECFEAPEGTILTPIELDPMPGLPNLKIMVMQGTTLEPIIEMQTPNYGNLYLLTTGICIGHWENGR